MELEMAKILVVDDSGSVRNGVSDYLRAADLEVITAIDGIDAFNKISTDANIGLAIVDINMPNLDGLSFVQRVRDEMPENQVIFIMLTTEFSDELKQHGLKLGVRGWIVKPFKGELAINTIKKMLAI